MFRNLLSNAVKFNEPDGVVLVSLSADERHVHAEVSDTGIGIPSGVLPYVFDRFVQAESSSTRAHSGLGLGLAIVRHVIELHGGTVQAGSPGQGKGSTFRLSLPRGRDTPSSAVSDSAPILPPDSRAGQPAGAGRRPTTHRLIVYSWAARPRPHDKGGATHVG